MPVSDYHGVEMLINELLKNENVKSNTIATQF